MDSFRSLLPAVLRSNSRISDFDDTINDVNDETDLEAPRWEHLLGRVFNTPLLATEEKAVVVASVILARIGAEDALVPVAPRMAPAPSRPTFAEGGKQGTVAVVPVTGTLVHRAMAMSEPGSGLTSYSAVRRRFDEAMSDPGTEHVVLDIDSHGGEATGVFELASYIASRRGVKPITAVADSVAYSAAYAIASAADRIVVPRVGGVGSVGVIWLHADQSKLLERMGVRVSAIYAGAKKNDRSPFEPLSASAKADAEASIQKIYSVFVQTVAANRGVDEKAVRATEAQVYMGEDAVKAGLADEVADARAYVENLAANRGGKSPRRIVVMAKENENQPQAGLAQAAIDVKITGAKELVEEFGAAAAGADGEKIVDLNAYRDKHTAAGKADGEKAERERAKAITELCMIAGTPEILAGLLASGESLEQAREKIAATKAGKQPELKNVTTGLPANGESFLVAAVKKIEAKAGNESAIVAAARRAQ